MIQFYFTLVPLPIIHFINLYTYADASTHLYIEVDNINLEVRSNGSLL